MIKIGYWLASELHGPGKLVQDARKAEEVGFDHALISDHYLPWLDEQGHSPFVWSVIGGIAQATERLGVGTAVTCPLMRTHPAIIAQAGYTHVSVHQVTSHQEGFFRFYENEVLPELTRIGLTAADEPAVAN